MCRPRLVSGCRLSDAASSGTDGGCEITRGKPALGGLAQARDQNATCATPVVRAGGPQSGLGPDLSSGRTAAVDHMDASQIGLACDPAAIHRPTGGRAGQAGPSTYNAVTDPVISKSRIDCAMLAPLVRGMRRYVISLAAEPGWQRRESMGCGSRMQKHAQAPHQFVAHVTKGL
jgi:hypothetical protein